MSKDNENLDQSKRDALREAGAKGQKLGEKCAELGVDKKTAYPEYNKGKRDEEERNKPKF